MLLNAGCEKEQNLAHHEHYETAYISDYQPLQRRCDAGFKDDSAGQGRILALKGNKIRGSRASRIVSNAVRLFSLVTSSLKSETAAGGAAGWRIQ